MKPLLLSLAALALCGASAAAQRTLHPGELVDGSLARGDLRLSDGRYYDEYTFRARRGETVVVRLESEDFDAYLFLGEGDGPFRELARDDDGGDGRDARIRFVVPEDGRYIVRASSLHSDTGPYTLSLQGRRGDDDRDRGRDDDYDRDRDDYPRRGDDERYLRPGATVRDFLSRADPRLDNGSAYHLYRYSGRRGERVSIHLHSEAFDAYLVLGTPGGRHGVDRALARDDDGGGGLDSHIQYTLPHDGEYVIRVNPVDGEVGRYVLEMRSSYRAEDRPRRPYPEDEDDYDARIDERLIGRWALEAPGRSVREPGGTASLGTLRIRATGEYLWVRRNRMVSRGTLEPQRRPGTGGRPRYVLEDRGEQFEVYHNGRTLELRRRASGQVVAEGYRDRGAGPGVTRSVEEVEWDAEDATIVVEPADSADTPR